LNAKLSPGLSNVRTLSADRTQWLLNAARAVLAGVQPGDSLARPFLYIFLAHGVILATLPISVRAQKLPTFSSEVEFYLRNKFLPSLFIFLERSFPDMPTFSDVDLDGRVFFHLLKAIHPQSLTTEVMSNLIGLEYTSKLTEMWDALGMDKAIFSYPPVGPRELGDLPPSPSGQNDFRVLPFSHPVLDQYLSQVQTNALPSSPALESGRFDLDSGLGKVFKDNMHWHSPGRPILPKHLGGGEDDKKKTLDSKARARALRGDQRFQAGLQLQAQSLTGALGNRLEPITILPYGKGSGTTATKPVSPSTRASARLKAMQSLL
jgi:ATP-dependent RNA helicase DDX60